MRNTQNPKPLQCDRNLSAGEAENTRPGRIAGATAASLPSPAEADLAALYIELGSDATVTGGNLQLADANPGRVNHPRTVSLSDGTRIVFVSAGQFTFVDTA